MNVLSGKITSIESEGSLALVELVHGELSLSALMLCSSTQKSAWICGQTVRIAFQENEVALAKDLQGLLSLRNRMPARVLSLECGRLMTRAHLELKGGAQINAVITTRSAHKLNLQVGDAVEALVKSNEMTLLEVVDGHA